MMLMLLPPVVQILKPCQIKPQLQLPDKTCKSDRTVHQKCFKREPKSSSPAAAVSTKYKVLFCFCFRRSVGSKSSVRQRAQDEEAILLLPDPLQQLVDGRDGYCLGPQRTEAEVELKAICHLRGEKSIEQAKV